VARPKISVITACHNAGPFLPECLDSILDQTLAEWELLLLDDGSTDGTRAVIEHYASRDHRIRPFFFDESRGPYMRRNYAISCARADFIAIQDADDLMYPNKLARLHEVVHQNPRLGVVGSYYRMFLDGHPELDHTEDVILPTTQEEILRRYLAEGVCDFSWHGTAIIRKELFNTIGPYDENPFGADSLWLLKVLEYAKRTDEVRLENIPEYLTLRRMHLNSQTGRLPSYDPRSPRVKYWKHAVGRLEKVLKRVDADPRADVAAALRGCTGNDFFEQNGHLFEQWKKAPLTREIAQHLVNTIRRRFEHGRYIQSLIAAEMVEQLIAGVASQVPFYDYIRGLAYFCLGFPARSRECLEREVRAHGTSQAQDFLRRYVETYDTAWDRRDRAKAGARAGANISEGTDGGEASDTARGMPIGRKPAVAQDMCRSGLGAAPGPVRAERDSGRKRTLAELDRKYRAMADQATAKHAVAVRLSELCRRVGLIEKSTELAMEAETLRRRGGVSTSNLPAEIALRATEGG
jgi:glycosyltransferase involved in cell wall biosynthesis